MESFQVPTEVVLSVITLLALALKILRDALKERKNGTNSVGLDRNQVEAIVRKAIGNPAWKEEVDQAEQRLTQRTDKLEGEIEEKIDQAEQRLTRRVDKLEGKIDDYYRQCVTCQKKITELSTKIDMRR